MSGFYINYNKIDSDIRAKNTMSQISDICNINFRAFLADALLKPSIGFKKVLKLYEKLEPNWVNIYNREEEKKPESVQSRIPSGTTMDDIIKEVADDKITQLALATVVSNRIAHFSLNTERRLLEIKNNKRRFGVDFKMASSLVSNYFNALSTDDKNKAIRLERDLYSLGITFTENERSIFKALVEAQNVGFMLKDTYLRDLLTVLRERKDINYGLEYDENNNEIFVMDLPYYGQFSVHIKKQKYQSSLTDLRSKRKIQTK